MSCVSAPTTAREVVAEGWNGAQLYGRDPGDGVGGFGAFFLLLDDPEVYGLAARSDRDDEASRRHVGNMAAAAAVLVVGVVGAFLGGRS